jgi:hypothetical protein
MKAAAGTNAEELQAAVSKLKELKEEQKKLVRIVARRELTCGSQPRVMFSD